MAVPYSTAISARANGDGHEPAKARNDSVARVDPARSDLGNAQRLVAEHGSDLRHVHGEGWMVWGANRWQPDLDGETTRRMSSVTETLLSEALTLPADERKAAIAFALGSQGARRISAAIELAATHESVAVVPGDLDASPMLLSVANGVLDLRTGALRAADRGDLITLGSDIVYDADAPAPRWERFLAEVFAGDTDLIACVQRLVGYCLTGDTREHVLPVLHGAGGNGKSTLVTVLERLLGDLALTAGFETFLASHGAGAAEYDLARFRGARLVIASESAHGRRLDDRVVKQATGGDTITARHPYGRPFSYRPAFKVILVTNHRPHVDGDDDGIWRRLRLVPFDRSFVGREDKTLDAALARELPGILAWAVRGCLAWQRDGLGRPQAVTDATTAYRDDEDTVGAFLNDRCTLDPAARTTVSELRPAYEGWCQEHGERVLSAKDLTQALTRREGVTTYRTGRARGYNGVAVVVTRDRTDGRSGNPPHARAQGKGFGKADTTCHASPEPPTTDLREPVAADAIGPVGTS